MSRRKRHWHVTVVPVDERGDMLPGYELGPYSNWTDAEPPQYGYCYWKNGEILSPLLAEDIAGIPAEDLAEIAETWKVVVQRHME